MTGTLAPTTTARFVYGTCVLGLVLAITPLLSAAQGSGTVGDVVLVRGLATIQTFDGDARVAGPGSSFSGGEFLRTAAGTFAVVKFADDTRVTIRPSTTLEIQSFTYEGPDDVNAEAELFLHEGGVRINTGDIAEINPDLFELTTPQGRVRVHGTDFEVRLCSSDCDDTQLVAVTDPSIVAKVAFASGEITASDATGDSRRLYLQAPLRVGDTVDTGPGALGIVVYRDESRVTLRPNSSLEIVELEYDPEDEARSSGVMRFLKGGARVLSGAISKVRPRAYRVETPVAILSVRGTGFDLLCRGSCVAPGSPNAASDGSPPVAGDGMDTWVFEGAVEFPYAGGTYVMEQGQAVFFDGVAAPRPYPQVPAELRGFSWPEPDASLEGQDLFGAPAPDNGLYVRVNEGSVEVSNQAGPDIVAEAGETVFGAVGDNSLELLDGGVALPPTPDPTLFGDQKVAEIFEFLAQGSQAPQDQYQCVIQ